ncbi:flagellar biosynthesis protein FlhA [Athalassotoga saccharophila]|uniref:flagellar biosynthesis protein FlhA n=1 Tax=Athalassotoga saccharophila TaxID=1441386 RepID=UPI00137AB525|nr:flagellar biosynthesis protein FlhA [Athalassotoga saccharophila]BBJ27272.1 flagellar biosynthesis protein FlhA [Athalassotoga saccharophila]
MISRYGAFIVAIGVLFIVLLMILPLNGFMLDLLQIIDISISSIVLMDAMFIKRAIDLSSFPTLVLVMTLFRIALNVAATRMILLDGKNFPGHVIIAFGNFVVGGNYIVGIVVFFIIVIVQYIVITRGTERISEVAARFTLDAMPGKQMAIDADYNAGVITESEAKKRRDEVRREADFYGAMDGASKFVRGDAISSIVIVFINIIGGLIIGMLMQHMSITDAAQTYTLLTVGDGLVEQIPALLMSVASGIIVSRAASTHALGEDVIKELGSEPRILIIVGVIIALLGIFTPLPKFSTILIGSIFILFGIFARNSMPAPEKETASGPSISTTKTSPSSDVSDIINTDTAEIEIGYSLIPLADKFQGGDLLDRVTMVRKQIAYELGLMVSPIRVRDSVLLKPNEYVIKILGAEVSRFELFPNKLLAINSSMVEAKIEGIQTREPAFGLEAFWINEDQRERARGLGYTVVDAPSVFATHLMEVLRSHASELLGRREMELLLEGMRQKIPSLVNELIPSVMKEYTVRNVLKKFLKERISIRNLPVIFEALLEHGDKSNNVPELYAIARIAMKRQITESVKSEDGYIHAITLSQNLEEKLSETLSISGENKVLNVNPELMSKIIDKISLSMKKVMEKRSTPVILCSSSIREALFNYISRILPKVSVVAYEEITDDAKLKIEDMINIGG